MTRCQALGERQEALEVGTNVNRVPLVSTVGLPGKDQVVSGRRLLAHLLDV